MRREIRYDKPHKAIVKSKDTGLWYIVHDVIGIYTKVPTSRYQNHSTYIDDGILYVKNIVSESLGLRMSDGGLLEIDTCRYEVVIKSIVKFASIELEV